MFDNPWRSLSVAALGFSILAVSLACGGGSSGSGSSSNSSSGTSSTTPAPTSAGSSEDQVVGKAIQAQNRLRDLTLTTQSDTIQGGRSFTTQAKVEWTASPERFYAKTTSSLTNRQTEVIVDTPTQATYVKSGANWIKTPAGSGSGSLGSGFMPALKGDAFKGFKVVGQENVEGKPAWHLSGPMPFTPGSTTATSVPNTSGTLDVWVSRSDYQLVKQVEDLKSSDSGGFSLKATAVVDSVNSGISIDLPAAQ
ncbi:MAG: hypothetical protein M3Z97_08470 [Candidatus Dormibacteraeota bacterium]|nr:hypothetical protein [Candidatus Dormibacteraeota bacterium]